MGPEPRTAAYMSTPMIKGELSALLKELVPEKSWPKSAKLKDFIAFALERFDPATSNPEQRRALELAHVIHDRERR